jgi:hypothetical protein
VSDIIPIFIVIGLIFFVVLRVRRQAGGPGPRPLRGRPLIAPPAANPPALRLLPLPGDIGLVAAREFR